MLDRDLCLRALHSRDARFDGRFFIAVRTTHIYCRPICPARTPLEKNVVFYETATEAERAGYRACLRCRPEAAPASGAWSGTGATVRRALTLIDEGALDGRGVDDLARRVGVGSRHLRRLFLEHVGTPPNAIAQTRRAALARRLLEETEMTVTEVAWAAGYRSLRRFNAAMREAFGLAPGSLRGRTGNDSAAIEVRLDYRPPFDWDTVLRWLRPRAISGIESVRGGAYARGGVRITNQPDRGALLVRVPAEVSETLRETVLRTRRLFDLGAEPYAISETLRKDALLAPLLARLPGVRVPGAWDAFELAVRVIAGRSFAATHRLAPECLAQARMRDVPRKRRDAVRALARAVASGQMTLERGASLEESIAMLCALPGIEPRDAQLIAMHGFGESDAFPSSDPVLRRKTGLSTDRLTARAEAWRPWRAYAAMLLWMA